MHKNNIVDQMVKLAKRLTIRCTITQNISWKIEILGKGVKDRVWTDSSMGSMEESLEDEHKNHAREATLVSIARFEDSMASKIL